MSIPFSPRELGIPDTDSSYLVREQQPVREPEDSSVSSPVNRSTVSWEGRHFGQDHAEDAARTTTYRKENPPAHTSCNVDAAR